MRQWIQVQLKRGNREDDQETTSPSEYIFKKSKKSFEDVNLSNSCSFLVIFYTLTKRPK